MLALVTGFGVTIIGVIGVAVASCGSSGGNEGPEVLCERSAMVGVIGEALAWCGGSSTTGIVCVAERWRGSL